MRLYHVSEQPGIAEFVPRPSPQQYPLIQGNTVFAITGALLPNYLLPRNCPRVCYYKTARTTVTDEKIFLGNAQHVVAVEEGWLQQISNTTLFVYEFNIDDFVLLDECAGYYIAYTAQKPIGTISINNLISEIEKRGVAFKAMPGLHQLANAVSNSSLNFSLIRMRNATII